MVELKKIEATDNKDIKSAKEYYNKHVPALEKILELDSNAKIVTQDNGKVFIQFFVVDDKPQSRCRLYVQKSDKKAYSHLYVGNVTKLGGIVHRNLNKGNERTTWNCAQDKDGHVKEYDIFSNSKEELFTMLDSFKAQLEKKQAHKKAESETA